MPGLADGDLLVRFLEDEGDLRVAVDVGEEAVDVDRAETPGEGFLFFRQDVLVADGDDRVVDEGLADGVELSGVGDVGTEQFGPNAAGEGLDFKSHMTLRIRWRCV